MKCVVCVVFVNCPDPHHSNVDQAARELEKAGFEAVRLPAELVETLDVESDDFLEAYAEGSDAEAMRDQVEAIVRGFGGNVDEWGPVAPGDFPFSRHSWPA
jgi:hypothetical protein